MFGLNEECPICVILSRPDDLSALDAYVREKQQELLKRLSDMHNSDTLEGLSEALRCLNEELK